MEPKKQFLLEIINFIKDMTKKYNKDEITMITSVIVILLKLIDEIERQKIE